MKMEGQRVVVTGGCGFIGSWIAELLSEKNDVAVLDDFSTGKNENMPAPGGRMRLIKADVRDREAVLAALRGADVVFHQAANVRIQASIDDPLMDSGINVGGTLNVLDACRRHGVKKMVFASSSSVYGDPDSVPVDESAPLRPKSPYALSKLSAERYVTLYSELYGLHTASLRYFNVYGPRQNADSPYSGVISIFAKNISAGNPITIYGDGKQTRDFVSVRDVARANLLAAEYKGTSCTVNIGTGRSVSISDVAAILCNIAGKKAHINYKEAREGDVMHSRASIGLARKLLGYEPAVRLEDGLKELLGK